MKYKYIKRTIWILLTGFILMNAIAALHAYKFTHFTTEDIPKTKDATKLNTSQKIKTLVFGVNNPRPVNDKFPEQPYQTILLQSNRDIECWYIPRTDAHGTVIIYHGFSGNKSSMLDKAHEFHNMGYNVLMVDFMGSGGSQGIQTTIGYFEADQVKTSFDYISNKGEQNIFLFGTSMGSVAIMKAIHDFEIKPKGIIIECPFGSMYKTVCARFKMMNTPCFPMAGLLVFWGGIENGFWAFDHNPTEYAKKIDCPTLLLYGKQDKKVSRAETDEMIANLRGDKRLVVYPNAGHEDLLNNDAKAWRQDITNFLASIQ